jgi:hypothetical protein
MKKKRVVGTYGNMTINPSLLPPNHNGTLDQVPVIEYPTDPFITGINPGDQNLSTFKQEERKK